MEVVTCESRQTAMSVVRIPKADREQTGAWPHRKPAELVEQFNGLGPERPVKVLVLKRPGDAASRAESVWVLIADGDQEAGFGSLLSNVILLDGRVPRRGDLVEYRTINPEHKPCIIAWVDGRGD
jgi:hypothetical protein